MKAAQLPQGRTFRGNEKRSRVMHQVLPEVLDVRQGWVQQVDNRRAETLFGGVEIVPFQETLSKAEERLFSATPATVEETQEAFFGRLFQAVCDHIEAHWSPDKFHLLFHSSGWDSRIVALAVRDLWQENGDAWLGRLAVFAFGPEADEAARMMEYEGWNHEQMIVVREPERWLWPALDMDHVGRTTNGPQPTVPVSRYSLAAWLCKEKLLPGLRQTQSVSGYGAGYLIGAGAEPPEDLQSVSGFGSDYYLLGAGYGRLRAWADRHYRAATSIPLGLPGEILPWLSWPVLAVANESQVRDSFRLRPQLVAWLDERMAGFRRVSDDWPEFPPAVLQRAAEAYERSWYGRTCAPGASSTMRASAGWSDGYTPLKRTDWWSHWTAAAYCERLCKEGYELR